MFPQSLPSVKPLFVVLVWVATINACHERRGPNLIAQDATHVQVRRVMEQLEAGTRPFPNTRPQLQDGWEARLPNGRRVFRSELLAEAQHLVGLGPQAVPVLADWANYTNPAIRFVAIEALRQITGILAEVPYFDDADLGGERKRAIRAWRDWYSQQHSRSDKMP